MLTVYDPVFSFTQFLLDSPLLQQPVSHPSAVLQDRTRVSALLCQRRSPLSVVGRGGERWHTLRNGPLPLSAHLLTTRPLHGSFSDPPHILGVGPARVSCAYGCAVCQRSSQRWPRDARLPTAPHGSPRLPRGRGTCPFWYNTAPVSHLPCAQTELRFSNRTCQIRPCIPF